MAERLIWQLNASVAGGPTLFEKIIKTVEAYDNVSITIPAGAGSTTTVELQPAIDPSQVTFLALLSSDYDAGVTYTVDSGTAIALDGPMFLAGAGAVGILSANPPPKEMSFTVGPGQPEINITIFIGRDATPNYPPPP